MTIITHLKTLTGQELGSWYDSTGRYDVFPDARGIIADWGNCDLREIDYIETAGGEFFAIDNEPVAYLEAKFVRHPTDRRPLGPILTLTAEAA